MARILAVRGKITKEAPVRPKAGPAFLIIAIVVALVATLSSAALAQNVSPTIYSGSVTIGDNPAPDGLTLVARINDYESEGVVTKNGRYSFLIVSPPTIDYFIETITFHIPELDIQAAETDVFRGSTAQFEKALTFPAVEGLAPGPTPTPGAAATTTPTPLPTQPVAQPSSPPVVYFGNVTVNGQPAPDGLVIVARIEDYESQPITTSNGAYARLSVSPLSADYLFKDTTFHIPAFGVQAAETVLFLGGPAERPLDLTFPVLPEPTPTPVPTPVLTPVTLSIDTDRTIYNQGNLVTIITDIDGITSNADIAISVIDPSGNIVMTRTLSIDDIGSIPFKILHGTAAGSYKVTASTNINGQNYEDRSQFTIKKNIAGITILSVEPTDQQGNPVTSFGKNKQGFVKIKLDSDSSTTSLITVNIFDSDLTSLGTGSVNTTLSGQSELILSFFIPNNAVLGNADIYVNAFTDWPSNGGTPLTRESSANVLIDQ